MIRATGRFRNQRLELDQEIELADGAEVVVEIRLREEDEDWSDLSSSRLDEEWNNPEDALYDDWRRLYGVDAG